MSSHKRAKRIRKANKFVKNFVQDNFIDFSIPDFAPSSYDDDIYFSLFSYQVETETGTHSGSEQWGIYYKDSGKVDQITNYYFDDSNTQELGDVYVAIEVKKYKKFAKAWARRSDEFYDIIARDDISYLSNSNEAYELINWLDDLPGTKKGDFSSYISIGYSDSYFV